MYCEEFTSSSLNIASSILHRKNIWSTLHQQKRILLRVSCLPAFWRTCFRKPFLQFINLWFLSFCYSRHISIRKVLYSPYQIQAGGKGEMKSRVNRRNLNTKKVKVNDMVKQDIELMGMGNNGNRWKMTATMNMIKILT